MLLRFGNLCPVGGCHGPERPSDQEFEWGTYGYEVELPHVRQQRQDVGHPKTVHTKRAVGRGVPAIKR